MKDNTFIIIGATQTITMLIIMAMVARTGATILALIGITLFINVMCYVAHCILNKKHQHIKIINFIQTHGYNDNDSEILSKLSLKVNENMSIDTLQRIIDDNMVLVIRRFCNV